MKKIMFNDRYCLTQAVLKGRKTMTRRLVSEGLMQQAETYRHEYYDDTLDVLPLEDAILEYAPYKVGEIVAVAQSLRDMGYSPRDTKHRSGAIWGLDRTPAWTNKMFVSATECIHQIRITNVRVERLQDITAEDVYKEGFVKETVNNGWGNAAFHWEAMLVYYDNIGRTKEIRSQDEKEAFATLIDKVSGNGTWEKNPWVFVYEFELIK